MDEYAIPEIKACLLNYDTVKKIGMHEFKHSLAACLTRNQPQTAPKKEAIVKGNPLKRS